MSTEPVWPEPTARSLSRHCTCWDGRGGSGGNPAWDEGELLRTLRGNTAAAARVARVFLEECPGVAQRLRAAVRDGDHAALQRLTHRLKGNAGILRAPAVGDATGRLERLAPGEDLVARAEEHLVFLEGCLDRLCEALGGFLARTGG